MEDSDLFGRKKKKGYGVAMWPFLFTTEKKKK
jgi:hypothetical protein